MADIKLQCEACGKTNVFSEYTSDEARRCGQCGALLAGKAAAEVEQPLPLNRSRRSRPSLSDGAYGGRPEGIPEGHAILQGRAEHAEARMGTQPKVWPAVRYVVLLVAASLLIVPQWLGRENKEVLDFYLNYRYVLIGIAVVLALYDALKDSVLQAFLCVIVPFYIFYYAFYRVDSYWRSGCVIGVLLGVIAESYFIPQNSLFAALNRVTLEVIKNISRLIAGA